MNARVKLPSVARLVCAALRLACAVAAFTALAAAQGPENVLVVVNSASALSRSTGEYYARQRGIPARNVCRISTAAGEDVSRQAFEREIQGPVGACLVKRNLAESVLFLVTTAGVPLRISGPGSGMDAEVAAVDSELSLLYSVLKGKKHPLRGPLRNPFYGKRDRPFRHPEFPIYLVTRLAGYEFADIRGLVDRALRARNAGRFVIDLKSADNVEGNDWLRSAAAALPKDRVVLDETDAVLTGVRDVIGYASWGSNDPHRKTRRLGMEWLPGAIVSEFVSTNGRTFAKPPATWELGTWKDAKTWFAGAPQTLTADYLHEGATGASGHVSEPFLQMTPRPHLLLPAYLAGRTLAESYYLSMPALSWQNIVVGDPLCALGPPHP